MTTKQIHAAKSRVRGGEWQRKSRSKRFDPGEHPVEVTWYSEQVLEGELEPLRKWLGRGMGAADRVIAAEWRGKRLYRLLLSKPALDVSKPALDVSKPALDGGVQQDGGGDARGSEVRHLSAEEMSECRAFIKRGLVGLLEGESEPIPWSRMVTEDRTEFQQRVLQLCYQIPFGETLSYKALAERAGRPLAARAVGQAMATNRIPLLIPCHRVIAANQTLCGFSAPGGIATKRQLLALEAELVVARKSSW